MKRPFRPRKPDRCLCGYSTAARALNRNCQCCRQRGVAKSAINRFMSERRGNV